MNESQDQANFKRILEKLISGFVEALRPSSVTPFLGAKNVDPLEHITRAEFIDKILSALGWRLKVSGGEIVEEARVKEGEKTIFLDYLGVHPDTRAPQVIIEAKAWSKPMVAAKKALTVGGHTQISLIAAAIEHCKSGGGIDTSPVTAEWASWIKKLRGYVVSAHAVSGHVVKRAVITSGQWMVILTDPGNAFICEGTVNTACIKIVTLENYVEQSEEIFDLLAYRNIVEDPPAYITASRVQAYLAKGSVKSVHRALWLRRQEGGAHFKIHPQLYLYAAAVVRRFDGVTVTVLDMQSENAVPHNIKDELVDHLEAVQSASDALLDAIRAQLGELPDVSGVEEFPGFVSKPKIGATTGVFPREPGPKKTLLMSYRDRADEFLLVTGEAAHFLLREPTVMPCAGHDWVACNTLGKSKGPAPILARSVEPHSFFMSGEDHHCAHSLLHDQREERCLVLAFEEFLCCRACALQQVCWPKAELFDLPCGVALQAQPSAANAAGAR